MMPLIKICGICDPPTAEQTARLGADFIGIIFHPPSPRYVDLNQAERIVEATRKGGAKPVAVFVNHTDVEMHDICEATDIQIVQLHGATARACHPRLPDHYQRIYVQTVAANGKLPLDRGFGHLDPKRDLLLLDHPASGQGKTVNWQAVHYDLGFAFLLAGGLTASNVLTAMHSLKPLGVDVSSGVESSRGNKDIALIQEFITLARGHCDAERTRC
jgi:phosphoribosylanthranilate isomerase